MEAPASWKALDRLQREEAEALRTQDPHAQDVVRATRAEIIRLQAVPDAVSQPAATGLLERTRAALDSHTALLSFDLGDSVSWLWALDRGGLALYALPPRQEVESQIQSVVRAIREDSTDPGRPARICTALFSGRWLPGSGTRRAGCWRWTRGFSTCP